MKYVKFFRVKDCFLKKKSHEKYLYHIRLDMASIYMLLYGHILHIK